MSRNHITNELDSSSARLPLKQEPHYKYAVRRRFFAVSIVKWAFLQHLIQMLRNADVQRVFER